MTTTNNNAREITVQLELMQQRTKAAMECTRTEGWFGEERAGLSEIE